MLLFETTKFQDIFILMVFLFLYINGNLALFLGEAKKSGSLTYSQQQNQLYIFSSQMANRAVDSVASRAHPSIFHFHLDDPETKQFLQVFIILYLLSQ